MSHPPTELLEMVLRECARAAPHPWYPAHYAQATGVPREDLDAVLDQLRLASLVKLTEWMQGHGQGYQVTPEGEEVLSQPRLLERLRRGDVPRLTPARPPDLPTSRHALAGLRGEKIRQSLMDESRPVVTYLLVALNLVWFVVELQFFWQNGGTGVPVAFGEVSKEYQKAIEQAGAIRLDLVADQPWRLLTSAFVHIGLVHILFNMFALYRLGPLVERMLGRAEYLVMYLVAAVGGSVAAVLFNPGILTAGASGAICGLFGAMITWLLLNKSHLPSRIVQAWQSNIMQNVILIVIISLMPGVSWAGHLGGAVAGAIITAPLNMAHYGPGAQRWLGWAGAAAIMVVGIVLWQGSMLSHAESGAKLQDTRTGRLIMQAEEIAWEEGLKNAKTKVILASPKDANTNPAELKAYFQSKKAALESKVAELKEARPPAQPEADEAFKAALAFFVPTVEFLGKIVNVCDQAGQLPMDKRATLGAEYQNLASLRTKLVEAWRKANQ
jgi:membrane associated rhomboid family serine protease